MSQTREGEKKKMKRRRRESNYLGLISRDGEWIFNLLALGEKTDEGQSEMDGRRGRKKDQGVVKEREPRREGGGKTGSRRRSRMWILIKR